MKKQNRLKRNEDFNKIIKEGKKLSSDQFVVYYMPSLSNFDHHRIGISVGKKNGNAVTRNKVKRQIRQMTDFIKCKSYDYVIITKKPYFHTDFENNKKSLCNVFRRIYEK